MIISTKKTKWNTCIFYLSLFSILFGLTACGGGGGGSSSSSDESSSKTTTISGSVQLSSIAAGAKGKGSIFHASPLASGVAGLYDSDKPQWLYPVAQTLTDGSGNYTFDKLTNSSSNKNTDGSTAYNDNDPIPAGNYTVIAENITSITGSKKYVAVQAYVKNFQGVVTGHDLIAYDSNQLPAVISMFGIVEKSSDGSFGSSAFQLPKNAAIQITFNMAMARLSVLNSVNIKDDTETAVPGTWKVSPDLLSATFHPSIELSENSVFMVTVLNTAQNVYGRTIPATVTGIFRAIETDTTAPNVTKLDPASQTNVPVTTAIRIKSNEVLDINTFTVSSTPTIGDKPAIVFDGKGNDTSYPFIYQIKPNSSLQLNTDHSITISGAKDMAGNVMTTYTFNFKTTASADTTPPSTTASPAGGIFSSVQTVTLTTNETAIIYYTTNGTTPTTSSTVYTVPILLTSTTALSFFAVDSAGNTETPIKTETYTITASDTTAPVTTATPAGGSYGTDVTVTLSANEPATIYYTTDGSTPSTSSTKYTSFIGIASTTTLSFFAVDNAGNTETAKTETYTITISDTTAPLTTPTPPAGTYASTQTVALKANEVATIYYTTDGTTPTTVSTVYTGPITITTTTTLSFFAVDSKGNTETPKTATYTISIPDTTAPTTTATPAGNTYTSAFSVSLTTNEVATIYYTTDGTTPTTASTVYTGPISVGATMTLKFFAQDTAGNSETVKTEAYIIADITAPTTTASPTGGTYTSAQAVTLTTGEVATIYYTTDGTTPTTASTVYTGPISVGATMTLKFFARDSAGNSEAVKTETYTINIPTPTGLWDSTKWDNSLWGP